MNIFGKLLKNVKNHPTKRKTPMSDELYPNRNKDFMREVWGTTSLTSDY